MAEVQNLNLNHVRLVVLSACNTFKGELRADGVVGISRAFVAAGAPTLLASLWVVDDNATRVLMNRFYRRLFANVRGVALDVQRALQDTMISMIRDGYEIHEWAPFVVYGLSVDFKQWSCPNVKCSLEVELEDVLNCCRLSEKLKRALHWCKSNHIEDIDMLIELRKEEEFADALGLKPNHRRRLLRRVRKRHSYLMLPCPPFSANCEKHPQARKTQPLSTASAKLSTGNPPSKPCGIETPALLGLLFIMVFSFLSSFPLYGEEDVMRE